MLPPPPRTLTRAHALFFSLHFTVCIHCCGSRRSPVCMRLVRVTTMHVRGVCVWCVDVNMRLCCVMCSLYLITSSLLLALIRLRTVSYSVSPTLCLRAISRSVSIFFPALHTAAPSTTTLPLPLLTLFFVSLFHACTRHCYCLHTAYVMCVFRRIPYRKRAFTYICIAVL